MEATSSSSSSRCSPFLPPRPSSSSSAGSRHRRLAGFRQQKVQNQGIFARRRDGYDWGFDGRLVDESMIVLRRRIHETKMMERNYEPPEDWMEWEKKYYTSYDARICRAVGMLQSQLMNTRPSLALGMLALVGFSVPTSTILIMLHLMNVGNGILSAGIHLIN
ncbi:hypothetical protein NE237_006793 [Protea cynaroides]|uniref:Mediator of RNA polymerase II transcription subunit n=1 Tax=Protea cynaroides TaxID=273540 RepID=A0A9Q0QVV7_9MAGN|nr:hypothetical protein NE237_006793 [Protea cynaroides]